MRFKKLISSILISFISLSLCSNDSIKPDELSEQEIFNNILNELSPTLDRDAIVGDNDLELENN